MSANSPTRPYFDSLAILKTEAKRRGLLIPGEPADTGTTLPGSELSWQDWIAAKFPHVAASPMGDRHIRVWDWIDSLEAGKKSTSRVEIWGRGGGKSVTVELGLARICTQLSRRFGLYVSRTQDQADKHVEDESAWLQSAGARPLLSKINASRPQAWRRNQIRTENGFNLAAFGIDGGSRGIRIEQYRPDIIIFDDIDKRHDSPLEVTKIIEIITQTIMPTASPNCVYLFVQNLIHANSIASQLATNRADFLLLRYVTIEPAVRNLQLEPVDQGGGKKPLWRIIGGEATWVGQPLALCEEQINEWGYEAFIREAQHEVRAGSTFFDPFEEVRHVIAPPFTPERKPPKWWRYTGGMDGGYADPWAFVLTGVDEHGRKHYIESTQAPRLTNEQQATRVGAILDAWGIDRDNCIIGYDESMNNRPSVDTISAEAPIRTFQRHGLRCGPVKNVQEAQFAGFMQIRDSMRVPGQPSMSMAIWEGFNTDLIHAFANATHDRREPEKIAHDECSHLAQAARYEASVRIKVPDAPPAAKTKEELQIEAVAQHNQIQAAFRAADLKRRNERMGIKDETKKAKRPIGI